MDDGCPRYKGDSAHVTRTVHPVAHRDELVRSAARAVDAVVGGAEAPPHVQGRTGRGGPWRQLRD